MGAARIEFSQAELIALEKGQPVILEPCSAVSIRVDPKAGTKIITNGTVCPPDKAQCPSAATCFIQHSELYARFRSALG